MGGKPKDPALAEMLAGRAALALAAGARPADLTKKPDDSRKLARWDMHRYLRTASVRGGGRQCMDPLLKAGSQPSITVGDKGESRKSGVKRCSSLSCPVCGAVMRSTRCTEIDCILRQAVDAGDHVYFVTATLSHKLRDDLDEIWAMMQAGWSAAWGGRAPKAHGYIGQVRVIETTYGVNGFHPHIHGAVVFARECPREQVESFLVAAGTKYRQKVAKLGGHVTTRRSKTTGEQLGWNVQRCSATSSTANYLTKIEGRGKGDAGLAMELARGDLKKASVQLGRGLSQFELLELATNGDKRCAALFKVYEEAAKGRQLISIGKSLRDFYEVEIVSDEEAAVEAAADVVLARYSFTADRWTELADSGRIGSVEVMLYWHHIHGYLIPDWLRACRTT